MAKKAPAKIAPQETTSHRVSIVPIGSLTPDPANVRRHPERNQKAVQASLKRFGAGRSIVLDRDDVIVAGNETVNSATLTGFTEVLVVEPGPGQLVAVKRSDWSKTEATGYAIADNRSGDFSDFDEAFLAAQLEVLPLEGIELESLGFTFEEFDALTDRIDDVKQDGDWPEVTPPESQTIVIRYKPEETEMILRFLKSTDPDLLVHGKAGAKILERIREIAKG